MRHPGWTLVIIGAVIVGIGLVWVLAPSIPWLGRLPGDIRIEGENTRIYMPAQTQLSMRNVYPTLQDVMLFMFDFHKQDRYEWVRIDAVEVEVISHKPLDVPVEVMKYPLGSRTIA